MKKALRSSMDAMVLGTCLFCILASLRGASVRGEAFWGREARYEGVERLLIVGSTTWDRIPPPVRNHLRSAPFETWLLATWYKEARHCRIEKTWKKEPQFLITKGGSVAK